MATALKVNTPSNGLPLGLKYKDTLTGLVGVATTRGTYIYSAPRLGLEYVDKDGVLRLEWIDEARLVQVGTVRSGTGAR